MNTLIQIIIGNMESSINTYPVKMFQMILKNHNIKAVRSNINSGTKNDNMNNKTDKIIVTKHFNVTERS